MSRPPFKRASIKELTFPFAEIRLSTSSSGTFNGTIEDSGHSSSDNWSLAGDVDDGNDFKADLEVLYTSRILEASAPPSPTTPIAKNQPMFFAPNGVREEKKPHELQSSSSQPIPNSRQGQISSKQAQTARSRPSSSAQFRSRSYEGGFHPGLSLVQREACKKREQNKLLKDLNDIRGKDDKGSRKASVPEVRLDNVEEPWEPQRGAFGPIGSGLKDQNDNAFPPQRNRNAASEGPFGPVPSSSSWQEWYFH